MSKKLWSLTASAALVGGGVFAITPTASADPYPGSIDTVCQAHALNRPRVPKPAKVEFDVDTGGDNNARGIVTFSYERRSSGVVTREFDRQYDGPLPQKYSFKGIPRGKYNVKVFFNSKPVDSVYKNCRTTFPQRIRPHR